MNIEESLKRKKVQFLIKRVFDFFASAAGLIFLSPAFLVIALLIKKTSPGPVFFRQVRVGKDQKPFEIYKFRTMAMRREEGKKITVGKDRRITSIGSVLRKYKLDEFPQLINVFKGEMSLVGPRPEVPEYVKYYSQEELQVLLVAPGITEEASIVFRNESELLGQVEDPEKYYIEEIMPRKLRLNLQYLKNYSLWKDLLLIFRTFGKVFS